MLHFFEKRPKTSEIAGKFADLTSSICDGFISYLDYLFVVELIGAISIGHQT